jgi:lysophospholipase L1-like esterase
VNKTKPLTLALLGDSLTNCGYQDRLLEYMQSAGFSGFRPIGSRTGPSASPVGTFTPGKAAHDGYGGYTYESFLVRYAYAVDEIDNLQADAERQQLKELGVKIPPGQEWRRHLLKSPLVRMDGAKKTVDVQGWFDRINRGSAPDVILIVLGANDVFMRKSDGKFPNGRDVKTKISGDINRLVDILRAAAPQAIIALATTPSGGVQKAFKTNYGNLRTDYEFRSNALFFARLLDEVVSARRDPRIVLVPLHHALDHVKAYPENNALHPTFEGSKMLGSALYAWMVGSSCFE